MRSTPTGSMCTTAASSLFPPTAAATSAASISPRSCAIRSRRAPRSTSTPIATSWRSRCACSTTCSTPRVWPLPQQQREAMAKRRIGLGFTGLGDALLELNLRYDSEAGRAKAAELARETCLAAYRASVELAKEKGAFPLFDADRYLAAPGFASRLPRRPAVGHPRARHPQQPPAVDRADRHHLARVRRQREQRHRAAVLVAVHAPQAHARRHA